MGTTYSVLLGGAEPSPAERQRLASIAAGTLARIDGLMSTYKAESELSRFNRFASRQAFVVSAETLEVFRAARQVSELTGGAFDVTVAPLVDAWGFGAAPRAPAPPSESELARLGEQVGYRLVEIDPAARTLRKANPAVRCDLSAIAKGYAVDQVASALLEAGRDSFLVEVGGDLRGRGRRADGAAWQVAIERPQDLARSLFRVVALADRALATSGDYRNFYEQDGKRYSHLIDPRSGRPIAHAVASVSVAHANATWADALATGLAVLGPEQGLALAESKGLAALFILHTAGGGLESRATTAFRALADDAQGASSRSKLQIPNSKAARSEGRACRVAFSIERRMCPYTRCVTGGRELAVDEHGCGFRCGSGRGDFHPFETGGRGGSSCC
jgi:thiamine biosynthesis lipoprotein